jgi:hypothetical protein
LLKLPYYGLVNALSGEELINEKEHDLNIPKGFIGEVLESGGVIFIGFKMRSRSMHGWTAQATGGTIGNKKSAVEGIVGDSLVNSWCGLELKHAKFVNPEDVEEGMPYVQRDVSTADAVDLMGVKTVAGVEEMFAQDPELAEIDVIDSPWLTLSRLGLKRMAEVSPEGYLSVALPQLDEILFQ